MKGWGEIKTPLYARWNDPSNDVTGIYRNLVGLQARDPTQADRANGIEALCKQHSGGRLQNFDLDADWRRRAESQSAFTGRTTASRQAEFSRLEHLLPVFVKQHQHFGLDRYCDSLALSRLKVNALEADQLAERRRQFAIERLQVELDNFIPCDSACVFDRDRRIEIGRTGRCNLEIAVRKRRVG